MQEIKVKFLQLFYYTFAKKIANCPTLILLIYLLIHLI